MIMIPMTGGLMLLAVLYCGYQIIKWSSKAGTENGGMSVLSSTVLSMIAGPCIVLITLGVFAILKAIFNGLGFEDNWIEVNPYKFAIAMCSFGAVVIALICIFKNTINSWYAALVEGVHDIDWTPEIISEKGANSAHPDYFSKRSLSRSSAPIQTLAFPIKEEGLNTNSVVRPSKL
jgi:hypothetical protein